MKRLICLMLLGFAGCGCPEEKPKPAMGTYATNVALIVRKYDTFAGNITYHHIDIEIEGKVYRCDIPSSVDEDAWANMVQGRSYRVTTEIKDGTRYIWKCDRLD